MKISPCLSLLAITLLATRVAAESRSPTCTPQSIKINGTWQCFVTNSSGDFTGQTYTFTQKGNRFSSTGDTPHRIFGTLEGSAVSVSEVVNGEEIEGFVRYSQGHVISIRGAMNNAIVSHYRDSQGGQGSFNCLRK